MNCLLFWNKDEGVFLEKDCFGGRIAYHLGVKIMGHFLAILVRNMGTYKNTNG